jgi:hypothetical protein
MKKKNCSVVVLIMVLTLGMTIVGCGDEEVNSRQVTIKIKNSYTAAITGYRFDTQDEKWNHKYVPGPGPEDYTSISIQPSTTSSNLGPFTVLRSGRGGLDFDFGLLWKENGQFLTAITKTEIISQVA